jgi:hypothetical protein
MSARLFATSSTQAFGTRLVTSDTSSSATARAGRRSEVTLWQSEADRERSDEKARQIRPRVEQATGGTMQSVENYDVLFFDVRQ